MFFLKIPKNTTCKIGNTWIKFTGPLGSCIRWKTNNLKLFYKNNKLFFLNIPISEKNFYGSILSEIIWGITKGFISKLRFEGSELKIQILDKDKILQLKLGWSHFLNYQIPWGIRIFSFQDEQNILYIFGFNKNQVLQVTSTIRSFCVPNIYTGKGIFYFNEQIKLKEGKKDDV